MSTFLKNKIINTPDLHPMVEIVYVLECKGQRYYVGATSRKQLVKRLRQHRDGLHPQCKWTRKYNALKVLHHTTLQYENQVTIETEKLMQVRGIANVRGGDYDSLKLTPVQIRKVKRKFLWKKYACRRCGRTGHVITNCKADSYANGEIFSDAESDDEKISISSSSYSYSTKEVDNRPTPGLTWHSIPP